MASMLDGVREFVTPSLLSRLSSQTGETESSVSKGLMAVIPMLFGSIAGRSSDMGFMSQLASLATTTASDPDSLMRATKTASTPDTALDIGTPAGGWLAGLFGGNLAAITSTIARYAGVRSSSASSLLSTAAPLVLGYIGRMMRSDNLDASKLAQRFQSEKSSFAAALPSGFEGFLPGKMTAGVTALTDDVVRRAQVPAAAAAAAVQDHKRSGAWVLPALLAALVIGGLLWWGMRDRSVSETASNVARATSDAVGTAGTSIRMLARDLPGGVRLQVPSGGMEDRLIGYLAAPSGASRTFDFDRIGFETGSATLTAESRGQIGDLAKILIAYPSARVMIAGHTDNTGDESANVDLSRARAESVMQALSSDGVPAGNMEAQGFGSQNPIADNSTDAGRAKNRRVTLRVTGA